MPQEAEESMADEGELQEEAPEEAEEHERREGEPESPKAVRKKKKEKGVFNFYKIGGEGELARLRPFCERCGPGYFMADHRDRFTCGNCGFTRYKPSGSGGQED